MICNRGRNAPNFGAFIFIWTLQPFLYNQLRLLRWDYAYLHFHSGNYDYENELYKPIKESELASKHHFFLPHELENIDVNAKDELRQTDVLVAEVSYPSTGQGIELGQANVAGIPIVCFYKTGTKPSGSLRFVTDEIIEYNDAQDFLAKLSALDKVK